VDTSPDEPDDGERCELTPEQREKLRRLAGSLQGISMSKFDVKIPNIVDTRAFAKVAADAAKLSSFALPESTLKSFSALAAQQSRILDSLKPVLDMQSTWKKQFDLINSDFFKTHAATHAQFAKLLAGQERAHPDHLFLNTCGERTRGGPPGASWGPPRLVTLPRPGQRHAWQHGIRVRSRTGSWRPPAAAQRPGHRR
jgi:hypothetical protein